MYGGFGSIKYGITGLGHIDFEPISLTIVQGAFDGCSQTSEGSCKIADIVRKLDRRDREILDHGGCTAGGERKNNISNKEIE